MDFGLRASAGANVDVIDAQVDADRRVAITIRIHIIIEGIDIVVSCPYCIL